MMKPNVQRLLFSGLSLLILSIVATALAFYLDGQRGENLPFSLSPNESVLVFVIAALFLVYPVVLLAFALPFFLLKSFQVHFSIRALVYLMTGIVAMLIPTILHRYGYFYLVIALLFAGLDFLWSKQVKTK
ncbi:hypothetical protein [Paenibacillus massiliensis]|uniref:hypothetical protein n=1 Tax=Paenibacillus massiliensis TaxID=225917 RepID=UPI00048B7710|nr:hypothetical protein [Paenibacillus massiliensis]